MVEARTISYPVDVESVDEYTELVMKAQSGHYLIEFSLDNIKNRPEIIVDFCLQATKQQRLDNLKSREFFLGKFYSEEQESILSTE